MPSLKKKKETGWYILFKGITLRNGKRAVCNHRVMDARGRLLSTKEAVRVAWVGRRIEDETAPAVSTANLKLLVVRALFLFRPLRQKKRTIWNQTFLAGFELFEMLVFDQYIVNRITMINSRFVGYVFLSTSFEITSGLTAKTSEPFVV